MKRRRRQEGGITMSEDESMEQDASPTTMPQTSDSVSAAAAVVAEDAIAPGQVVGPATAPASGPQPAMADGIMPLDTLLGLPMVARWTPLSLRVRLWHNERRRTLSGDKRPKLSDLPGFLASHPQYRVHHDETRVLQVLELARDGIDGVHERHCAKCRSFHRAKNMVACQSCTYTWHRECLNKPIPDTMTLVCDECLRRNPFTFIAHYQNILHQLPQQQSQPLQQQSPAQQSSPVQETTGDAAPITVQIPKKFKSRVSDNAKRLEPSADITASKAVRDSNGVPNPEPSSKLVSQPQGHAPSATLASSSGFGSENNVFSRENFRLLFNFLSKLMDNGFISKHEQGLMKNLIIARDAQAVLMLSIVDIVEEGGDLNDAVDSLRRILLVS